MIFVLLNVKINFICTWKGIGNLINNRLSEVDPAYYKERSAWPRVTGFIHYTGATVLSWSLKKSTSPFFLYHRRPRTAFFVFSIFLFFLFLRLVELARVVFLRAEGRIYGIRFSVNFALVEKFPSLMFLRLQLYLPYSMRERYIIFDIQNIRSPV